jgi:hypothetical protein
VEQGALLKEAFVIPNLKPSYPQTFEAGLYRKPSYLSNLNMHGLGIIHRKRWFVKPISA